MNSGFNNTALTKLIIYWKEAWSGKGSSTFYSLDKPRDLQIGNHLPGMNRLEKLIERYKGKFKFAIIYLNTPDNSGDELRRYLG